MTTEYFSILQCWFIPLVCWLWSVSFHDDLLAFHMLLTAKLKLRLTLPCKSDCQPIFLKNQGIYSVYAKLWLLGPLIKNIPDSSHQYGSNVTFGASLAFQMRKEYVFEKKIFWKLDLKGGKMWRYAISRVIYAYF